MTNHRCTCAGNCDTVGVEEQAAQEVGQWAIVELMGRHVIAGFVSEAVRYGALFIRVDVPPTSTQPAYTKYFSAQHSVYGITPTTELLARSAAEKLRVRPVELYILPDAPVQRQLATFQHDGSELDED